MLVGWYPTLDSGHGLVSIVCTTWSILVSMTETVSLFVLATNNALPLAYMAVGCRPTAIDPTAADASAVSMTLTSPVVDVPRVLDRTGVGVERHDGVLPVERGVQGGPVGRVPGLAHQRGVGRRSPAVTGKVGAHLRER